MKSGKMKWLPVVLVVLFLSIVAYVVVKKKSEEKPTATSVEKKEQFTLGNAMKVQSCSRPPRFLTDLKIPQPVIIDLSQKSFKGIAFHYGKNFSKTLHPKKWEQYGFFGTYALDSIGDMYLSPMPYISIEPTTFNLQKNIYKLESQSGDLSLWMHLDEVMPSANNPYGINTLTYDCDDRTLWIASIDKSDYQSQKGTLYHIDIATKKVLQKIEGFDALTLAIVKTEKGKFLLAGSARDNGLYAFRFQNTKVEVKPRKLFSLPSSNEHIRKIKIKNDQTLELQAIPFSYTLVAESGKKDREIYRAKYNTALLSWEISKTN